ncbi:low molecular weight protein arginine phosphatase [Lentibacillus juripiscarius]|uniref:Low molecular weight protein arginine phosphatase n=1 Tax=Lentibacillus juripiscarius TaxID=257446 RepID=A0ABW5V8R0_9BACI
MKILFVCTGNTCRSPMAEALLKHRMPGAEVQSAGIFAVKNQRPNDMAVDVLKEKGISMDTASQPVTDELLNWADLVLTMTTQHKQSLILEYPNFQERFYTLKEYVSHADKEIWDELKQRYANYEMKRTSLARKQTDQDRQQLQADWEEIQRLERTLINYDISDPFGGDRSVYAKTLAELETYVDELLKKLND